MKASTRLRVLTVTEVHCRYEVPAGSTSNVQHPVSGTTVLVPVRKADGWADARPGVSFALAAAEAQAPNDADEEYLRSSCWPEVVAVAGRLAHVMVCNDLGELVALHESETGDQPTDQASPGQGKECPTA